MKKYLVLFGAAILVMALASPSMAQFKSWGHMEIQTIWETKPDFNTGGPWQQDMNGYSTDGRTGLYSSTGSFAAADRNETWRHVAERFRFYLQYGDPKTVRAVIGFEADSTDWGQLSSGTVTGGKMGVYRTDQVQLEIKHAYLDFVIPNTPLKVTAGLQNFATGGRLWMNNDAPGIQLTADFAPHQIQAFWWRENDNSRSTYGVNDTYGIEWNMKKQLYNIGAFGAYKNDLYTGASLAIPYSDHPWWIGVEGGFRPGNWDFTGRFIYNGGKREFEGYSDSDYSGFAGEVRAKYQIGPGMFAGLEGFYTTGNDADKSDKIKIYNIPNGSESQSIFGNDVSVIMWMNAAQLGYYHERNLAFMGMWYGRANFEYSPLAWLRLNLNYLYIGDTSKGTPGSYSASELNPFTKAASGVKQVNSPIASRQDEDKSDVGQEINLITTLNIYKNFDYYIGLAVFLPGSMYDTPTKSADTTYAINTKLIYAF
jgi:hypothetical protein